MTRNADITVDEGMMDHDIDFRDVMSELLKKRRKLAAVRLQFWPSAPQEIVKFLRDKLRWSRRTAAIPRLRRWIRLLFKLTWTAAFSGDGNPELFYPPARPMQAPAGL